VFLHKTSRYLEIREPYRHPESGKPTNRCVIRWRAHRTLEGEIMYQETLQAVAESGLRHYRLLQRSLGLKPKKKVEAIFAARVAKAKKRLRVLYLVRDELRGTGEFPRLGSVLGEYCRHAWPCRCITLARHMEAVGFSPDDPAARSRDDDIRRRGGHSSGGTPPPR
jgi:hypothetical protein